MRWRSGALLMFSGLLAACLSVAVAVAAEAKPPEGKPSEAAVASAVPQATEAGRQVLNAGGNAFDAAIAVASALAVVEPYSSGLGGGGFFLLHDAKTGRDVMIDAREEAPGAARRDMYLDAQGDPQPKASVDGALAAGIPGIPAALDHLARHYGRLSLSRSMAPAIALARKGFAVTPLYRQLAVFRRPVMQADPETARVFLDHGQVPAIGHRIRQPALADTLNRIAVEGRDGFYRGKLAQRLVKGVRAAGGIWTMQDLADYRVKERQPITARFRGFDVVSAAPPSSGGVVLKEMLNILSFKGYPRADPVENLHLEIEAMRRAYRDRAQWLGDPDFVSMPLRRLGSMDYAAGLAEGISPERATRSNTLAPVTVTREGPHTTHFSILDTEGNYVAATLSINYPFGACVTVPGIGVLLNDEMDDFSQKPGTPNVYGLVGAAANAIAPHKRPLSSMSPTFVRNGAFVGILGTPGGSRIITMVFQGVLAATAGEPVHAWVGRPRIHNQYLPDQVEYEPGALDARSRQRLTAMGHRLKPVTPFGNMQAVSWDRRSGWVDAAFDPRGEGMAIHFRPAVAESPSP